MGNKNLKENKFKRFFAVSIRNIVKAISKKKYIELQYQYITKHKLNFSHPKRYTEKLQYLRYYVYPKWDEVSTCAGRYGVREYIKSLGYEDSLIPIYGVYDKFEDIDFSKLPNKFAMKCTHASGFNYICFDKNEINIKELKKKFHKWLKTDYGKKTVEYHYSKIKPQIIIEELLLENGELPIEYKIHVFNGIAKNLYVVTGRGKDIRYTQKYIDWTPFDGSQFNGWKKSDEQLEKPSNFDQMVEMSENIAKKFPFVRVDLYDVNGKIYFSEMTFTPAKGTLILDDDAIDFVMGEWLDISKYQKIK
ncbi:MAG: ATP-grasp fold amidoligase family protein [Bacilli bacterium]